MVSAKIAPVHSESKEVTYVGVKKTEPNLIASTTYAGVAAFTWKFPYGQDICFALHVAGILPYETEVSNCEVTAELRPRTHTRLPETAESVQQTRVSWILVHRLVVCPSLMTIIVQQVETAAMLLAATRNSVPISSRNQGAESRIANSNISKMDQVAKNDVSRLICFT